MANKTQIKTLRKWADELSSGKYEQGSGQLMRSDPFDDTTKLYCCLGVLGKIHKHRCINDPSNGYLPDSDFIKWTGTSDQHSFVHMNDKYRWSFKKIAQQIRALANKFEKENLKKTKKKD